MEKNKERVINLMYKFNNIPLNDLLIDLSKSEFITLGSMKSFMEKNNMDKMNVNQIATLMNVSLPAVSRMLRNLEQRRLIKRNIDLFCRRNTFVSFTKKGLDLYLTNNQIMTHVLENAFKNISEREKEIIFKSYESFYNSLQDEVNKKIEGEK